MKLQSLTLEQCEQVRLWRNECLETLRTPYPLTKEIQAEFYHDTICNRNSPHRYWAIVRSMKDERKGVEKIADWAGVPEEMFIGMGGLTGIQWENRLAEISLIIDPALREKGYGEKSVDLLLDAAFNQMGLNCVYGECYSCNEARVFWGKIADKYNGNKMILRARKFWQGKFWDSLYFDILKKEYDKMKPQPTSAPDEEETS